MSVEVDLQTQPLINSVNKAVTALETLDKAVGNLGKGKSSIDILRSAFKEFESVGNASVKAMAAAGNQAVTELERLNKRQTSLKGLLGRVEGTKGALKPGTLIAVRKEFESNSASIAQTVKSLQTTLAGLYSEFNRRNVSTQALRGLKQELADVEAAAKQVKPKPIVKPDLDEGVAEKRRYAAWWNERIKEDQSNLNRIKFNLAEGKRLIVDAARDALKSAPSTTVDTKAQALKVEAEEKRRYAAWWNERIKEDQSNLNRIKFNLAEGKRLIVDAARDALKSAPSLDQSTAYERRLQQMAMLQGPGTIVNTKAEYDAYQKRLQQMHDLASKQKQIDDAEQDRRLKFQRENARYRSNLVTAQVTEALKAREALYQSYNPKTGVAGRLVQPLQEPLAPAPKLNLPKPREIDDVSSGFTKMSRAIWDSHSAVRGLASGFNLLWLTWGNLVPLMAGSALSFGAVSSFKLGANFEQSMFEIVNLAGMANSEADALKKTMYDLAGASTYTANEAAKAAKVLALAGLKGSEVSEALRPTLQFASAGGVTLEKAAEVLTAVGTAYGFSAKQYGVVADIITKASSDSLASVEDMGEAFKSSSVLAQTYGVSLTDAALALEMLANIGIKGSAAGTSARNFYTEIAKEDGKVGKMLKNLGVQAMDAEGAAKPLFTILRDLTAATVNLTGKEQARVAAVISNERGQKLLAAGQANFTKELEKQRLEQEKTGPSLLRQADAMQAVGNKAEASALRLRAVEAAYIGLRQASEASTRDAAGITFFADLERQMTSLGTYEGVIASLQRSLLEAFDMARPTLLQFGTSLRETFNSQAFRNDVASVVTAVAEFGKGLLSVTQFLYEHKTAVATAVLAYAGFGPLKALAGIAAAAATGLGTLGASALGAATGLTAVGTAFAPLAASGAAAAAGATLAAQSVWAVATGSASAVAPTALFTATVWALRAALIALPVAAVFAGAFAIAKQYADKSQDALQNEIKAAEDRAKLLEQQRVMSNDAVETEIENLIKAQDARNKSALDVEKTTRKLTDSAYKRIDDYYNEMEKIISLQREVAMLNELRRDGATEYSAFTVGETYTKRIKEVAGLRAVEKHLTEERIKNFVNLKQAEQIYALRESAATRVKPQGGGEGAHAATSKFGQRAPYQDLKDFTSTVAALGKAELDALKNSRIAKLAELKDYHDAGIISEGNYQAQVISVTEVGYKAESAKLKENLDRELTELDAYRAKVVKNDKLQADDKFDRLQSLSTKKLAIEAQYQTDVAKLRQDADDAERNAAIKQAKDLMEIRKKTEEAIAASMDRREALREESEVANRTAGLAGPELDAVHARLKVELQGRKDLRRIGIAAADERTKAAEFLASYEQDLDAESAAKKWEAYLATNDKINALLSGRSRLEKALGEEAAEAYAHAYKKSFKKIADEIAESLSSGITDALFTGGKEGWKKLRDTLKKELLMKPFQMVVKAIIQPVAQGMANVVTNALYGGNSGGGGLGNLFSRGADLLGSTVFGSSSAYASGLGLASSAAGSQAAMLAAQTAEFGASGLALTAEAMGTAGTTMASAAGTFASATGALGAAMPYIGAILAVGSLLKGMDDSGTMHTGGLAQYSATGGLNTSTQHGVFGMGFGGVDFGQQGTDLASNMAKGVVGILDSTATAFGKTAGYTAATAFADDTSKDGAWGGLLIKKLGETVLNWDDARTSRWAPKEFADGEAGAKEYAAAVAKDVRNVLMEQTPEWADTMLNALGDAPTLDQLAATVGQINEVATALKFMGQASEAFAGMAESATSALMAAMGGAQAATAKLGNYYTNFYTESERTTLATKSLTVEMAAFGKEMPATRDAFKGLVDTAIAAGDTTLAANLLNVADKFAAVVPAAEGAAASTEDAAASTEKLANAAQEAASLRERLNEVMLTETELIAKKREAILPVNQALYDMVTALESLATAAESVRSIEDALTSSRESAAAATESVRQSIRDYIKDLTQSRASTASPTDALKYARENYINDLRLAKSGDTEAAKRITDSADKYIEAQKGMTASSTATQAVIDQVLYEMRGLESLPGLAATGDTETTKLLKELKLAIEKMSLSISDAIHFDLVNKLGEIDLNRDLAISKEEFTAAFSHLASESSLNKVFTTLDLDGDAQISKLEAIVGNTNATALAIAGLSTAITQLQAGTITSAQAAAQISGLTQVKGATAAGTAITANTGGTVNTATGPQDVYVSSGGAVAVGDTIYGTSGTVIAVQDAISNVEKALAAGDPYSVYYAARADGVSAAGLDAMMGWAPGTSNSWAESVGLQAFAKGGAFSNGVITEPTRFDMGLMGEAGPEAIMPLTRMANGALGVAYSGQQSNAEMVAELKALRAELADLKVTAAAGVRVAQAVGKAQIEQLESIADATADSAQTNKMMELAR